MHSVLLAVKKYKCQFKFSQRHKKLKCERGEKCRQCRSAVVSEVTVADGGNALSYALKIILWTVFAVAFQSIRSTHRSSTRRYARYRTEIPVIVKVLAKDGYVRIHGRCFELAEAGLGAVITSELKVGEMVTLEFSIPDAAQIFVIRSVVRHRMGFLHGFEFVGALPEQIETIQKFCRTLEST